MESRTYKTESTAIKIECLRMYMVVSSAQLMSLLHLFHYIQVIKPF